MMMNITNSKRKTQLLSTYNEKETEIAFKQYVIKLCYTSFTFEREREIKVSRKEETLKQRRLQIQIGLPIDAHEGEIPGPFLRDPKIQFTGSCSHYSMKGRVIDENITPK